MGIWRRSTRRWLASAATLPLLVGGLTLSTASSASGNSIPCTHPAWTNPDTGSGHVLVSSTPMYTGPEASCGVVDYINPGTLLYYHCYVVNANGYHYTHLRIAGDTIQGWIYSARLDDGGASHYC